MEHSPQRRRCRASVRLVPVRRRGAESTDMLELTLPLLCKDMTGMIGEQTAMRPK